MRNAPKHMWLAPRKGIIKLVEFYQATLSPDHGLLRHLHPYGFCRHEPTCSQFAKEMLAEHGVVRSIPKICRRLLGCHPWAKVQDGKILSVCGGKGGIE